MTTPVRRFAAVAVLATGLLTSVTPLHTHAQTSSVNPSVRAVLKPLYLPLYNCTTYTQSLRDTATLSVLGSLWDGGMPNTNVADGVPDGNAEPNRVQNLASLAAQTVSYCGTVVRLVHHTQLSGPLARNTTLRHVLDQLAAYASDDARGSYYFVKVAADIQSDDAANARADMESGFTAMRTADGHLSVVASYIGKL